MKMRIEEEKKTSFISQDKGESPSLQGLTLEVFGLGGVPGMAPSDSKTL
jgi:hypothetical protein